MDDKKLEDLVNKYQEHFSVKPDMLKHILFKMINESEGGQVIFAPAVKSFGTILGKSRRGETGYYTTGLGFEPMTTYDMAADIAEQLTKDLFGIGGREYDEIHIQALGV